MAERGARARVHQRTVQGRAPVPAADRGARPHGSRRSALAPEQERVLELQRLAGNAAVASAIGSIGQRRSGRVVTDVRPIKIDRRPSPPADGLKTIRAKKKGAGIMGYTIRSIDDRPPMFRPEQPVRTEAGWTAKPRSIANLAEPFFEEYWPTKGRHLLAEHQYMEIDGDWEEKLKVGEDQHVTDTTLAWEQTWKTIAGIINALAAAKGPAPQGSEDAARAELAKRFVKALPEDMRPEGGNPTEPAQREVWGADQGTLFRWMWDTTVVRDTRDYHTPGTAAVEAGKDDIRKLVVGQSNIPGPTSVDLIKELRQKYTKGRIIKGTEPAH
jgi:hypothetical protein